jgi:hypothetical protein
MASILDAHDRAFAFFKGACTRGIYDSEAAKQSIQWIDCPPNEDGGGGDLHGQGAAIQPPLPADVQPLSGPAAVHWARTNGATMNGPAPPLRAGRRVDT